MADRPGDPSRLRMGSQAAGAKVRVGPNAAAAMAAMEFVKQQVQGAVTGEEDPVRVKKRLVAMYMRGLMQAALPGHSSLRGHCWATITVRVGGAILGIDWEYAPRGPSGMPSVLAFCPECYWNAPTGARTADATKPVFIDNQLGRVPGNPESDLKFVAFEIRAVSRDEIQMDERNRLTINRPVSCPQRSKCGWTVKIADGIAERISRGIVRPGATRASTGPIILKAKP